MNCLHIMKDDEYCQRRGELLCIFCKTRYCEDHIDIHRCPEYEKSLSV